MLKGTTLIASYDYNYKGERTRKVTTAAAPQGAQVVRYANRWGQTRLIFNYYAVSEQWPPAMVQGSRWMRQGI